MKRFIFIAVISLLPVLAAAQTSERMALPDLKFADSTQTAIFKAAATRYNLGITLGFEDEELLPCWEGYQYRRMLLAFMHYVKENKSDEIVGWMSQKEREELMLKLKRGNANGVAFAATKYLRRLYSEKDAMSVVRALADWCMSKEGKSASGNIEGYKSYLGELLAPVEEKMQNGPQVYLNQLSEFHSLVEYYIVGIKNQIIISGFESSALKEALQNEADAWADFIDSYASLSADYKKKINNGLWYSMLPLEINHLKNQASLVRDTTLNVLYAFTVKEPGAVYPSLPEVTEEEARKDLAIFNVFLKEMEENGLKLFNFMFAFESFISSLNEVKELLPENQRIIYERNSQRYARFINRTHFEGRIPPSDYSSECALDVIQ